MVKNYSNNDICNYSKYTYTNQLPITSAYKLALVHIEI